MATIYLCEQGSAIHKKGHRLLVEKNDSVLLDIPLLKVQRIFIFGNVQVSTQALAVLLDNDIDVSFFNVRGRLRGSLVSHASRNVFARLAQYDRWRDPIFKTMFARALIAAKLRNMIAELVRFQHNHSENDFRDARDTIEQGISHLAGCEDPDQLMGIEGAGSRAYFQCFARMMRRDLCFLGRAMHPAPDPVNALLSLGYTLVLNELASLIEAMSLDPYLGFLHGLRYGRQSLALDLLEQFRQPLVDQFTLNLINLEIFQTEDFEGQANTGVYLKHDAFRKYLERYEARMREGIGTGSGSDGSWREILKQQVANLESSLRDCKPYQPFQAR